MLLNWDVGEDSWESRRSNQSILKVISPEYSLEGLMLKLKLHYFSQELTHWKRPLCWERLKAGGEGDNRGWTGWMVSLTQWTWVWASSGSWWWTGKPGVLQSIGSQSRTWLSNWTDWTESSLARSLAGYSPCSHRIRHDWATGHTVSFCTALYKETWTWTMFLHHVQRVLKRVHCAHQLNLIPN